MAIKVAKGSGIFYSNTKVSSPVRGLPTSFSECVIVHLSGK